MVNIHGGGGYGDKPDALARLAKNLNLLSARARALLTLENDDTTYTPSDLLPICRDEGIPLVYDVHHHRCNPDELSVEEATREAIATWDREPLFHLSSPLAGWQGKKPRPHHDFIDVRDVPQCWRGLALTVEVEAKAQEEQPHHSAALKRELAIKKLSRRAKEALVQSSRRRKMGD